MAVLPALAAIRQSKRYPILTNVADDLVEEAEHALERERVAAWLGTGGHDRLTPIRPLGDLDPSMRTLLEHAAARKDAFTVTDAQEALPNLGKTALANRLSGLHASSVLHRETIGRRVWYCLPWRSLEASG